MASWFHLDDVPRDVVAEDNRLTLTVVPRRCAAEGSAPFILHEPASHIEIPVFLAYGSVDVSPDPAREVSAFSASRDITLMRLAHSGHCHNMASTRSVLWDRMPPGSPLFASDRGRRHLVLSYQLRSRTAGCRTTDATNSLGTRPPATKKTTRPGERQGGGSETLSARPGGPPHSAQSCHALNRGLVPP